MRKPTSLKLPIEEGCASSPSGTMRASIIRRRKRDASRAPGRHPDQPAQPTWGATHPRAWRRGARCARGPDAPQYPREALNVSCVWSCSSRDPQDVRSVPPADRSAPPVPCFAMAHRSRNPSSVPIGASAVRRVPGAHRPTTRGAHRATHNAWGGKLEATKTRKCCFRREEEGRRVVCV